MAPRPPRPRPPAASPAATAPASGRASRAVCARAVGGLPTRPGHRTRRPRHRRRSDASDNRPHLRACQSARGGGAAAPPGWPAPPWDGGACPAGTIPDERAAVGGDGVVPPAGGVGSWDLAGPSRTLSVGARPVLFLSRAGVARRRRSAFPLSRAARGEYYKVPRAEGSSSVPGLVLFQRPSPRASPPRVPRRLMGQWGSGRLTVDG